MNAHPTAVLVESVAQARAPGCAPDLQQHCPRQGIAAALVLDLAGREHIEPVIVVDFYRSAANADA